MNRSKLLSAVAICAFLSLLISPLATVTAQPTALRAETRRGPATGTLPISFHYVSTFGETGIPYPSEGQENRLNNPSGIILDGSDNVYLVENGGKRLWGLAPSGENLADFPVGVAGQHGAFGNPLDVAIYDGKLWVADWNRLVVYSAGGTTHQEIYDFENPEPNQPNWFDCAQGLTFDAANRLYVVQTCGSNNVLLLTISGSFPNYHLTLSKTIGQGTLQNPQQAVHSDLTGSSAALFVSDDNGLRRCTEDSGTGDWTCADGTSGFQGRGIGRNPNDPTHLYLVFAGWNGQGIYRCDDSNCADYIVNPNDGPQVVYDPVDVAFDTDGTAFVTDRGDATVKTFLSSDLTHYTVFKGTQFSPYVTTNANFNEPVGVAIAADYGVLIVERQGQRLTRLSETGIFAWNFGVAGTWGNDYHHLNAVEGNPAVDAQGRIYIPDRNNGRVVVLSSTGTYLGSIGNQNGEVNYRLDSPSGVAIGPNGDIYIANQDGHNVKVYTADRFYQSMIGDTNNAWGTDNEHFNRPSGIAVADDQTVFVSDQNNQRVQRCTRPSASATNWTCATFIGVTEASNSDAIHLNQPASLAWDRNAHRLFVADQFNQRIQVFGDEGDHLATVGGEQGQGDHQFANPMGVAVDAAGALYVADTGNHRVQKYIPVVAPIQFAGQTGGPLLHMAMEGAYLYASAGPRVDVFSLADPDHPAFHGESDLLVSTLNDLAVQGNYAYLSLANNAGFAILDLTDRTHPVQISSLALENTTSVAVLGDRAYVGASCCSGGWSSARLFILDVSDKAHPAILNYMEWGDPKVFDIRKVVVAGTGNGQTVYVAAGNEGVSKVDVASVTASVAPTETGRYTTGGIFAVDLVLSADGALAFLADQGYGVRVISTSSMSDDTLDSVDTRGSGWTPNTISRDGDTVITTAGGAGVGIFNAATPTSISEQTHCPFFGSAEDALGSGTRVYIAHADRGLTTSPLPGCDTEPLDRLTRPGSSSGTLTTVGDFTYQATWMGGLRILDTTDPAHPQEMSVSNEDTSVNGVEVFTPTPGTTPYAYLVTGYPGPTSLRVMDVTDPEAPAPAGPAYDLTGAMANTLAVRQTGNDVYAYVPESGWYGDPDGEGPEPEQFNSGKFRILNVTNPEAIQAIGETENTVFDGQANDILLYNNFAFVSVSNVCDHQGNNCVGGGVQVFDVTDPMDPFEVPGIGGFRARFMAILDGRLYVAAFEQGLVVWDISGVDPASWHELGRYRTDDSYILGVQVENVNGHTYAYVADANRQSLQTLDVSMANAIQKINQSISIPGFTFDVNRIGKYVLVSAVNAGLYTFWVTPEVEADPGITAAGGGSLVSEIDGTTYTFAGGDVARDLRLLHTPILAANAPAPLGGRAFIGHIFSNSATDAAHDRPLTDLADGQTYELRISYDPAELNGVDETTLGLFYWNGSAWVQEASTTDTSTHTLTAYPSHFSLWSVQGWPLQEQPTGTLSVGVGDYTNVSSVPLTLSATGAQSSIAWMRFSNTNNGSDWTVWEAYNPTKADWALVPGDGVKTVYVQFRDLTGNLSDPIADSIILDTTDPVGSSTIANGAAYTTAPAVALAVSVTDANPGLEMSFSNDGSTWTGWEAFAATKAWTLPGGDGSKTVWTRFRDAAGNISEASSDTILLDTTAPTGSIIINGGATVALTTDVLLTLPASDTTSGVSQMGLSSDGSTWTDWESYSPSRSWSLNPGDGAKTVYVRYRDNAGLTSSAYTASITLDSTPPTGGVVFHGSPAFTNQASVTLDFTTSGVPHQMRYANQSSLVPAQPWQAFSNQKTWSLGSGDGVKQVFAQFKNGVGNVSPVYSASIVLDTTAPTGSLLINGGMAVTASPNVTLVLPTTETGSGVAQMMIANTDSFSGASWETYSATKAWALPGGDGMKTVYARFKDQAGNVSGVVHDSITLDSTAPSGMVIINGGQPTTTNRVVTLTIATTGGANPAESLMVANDASFTGASWRPFTNSLSWTLSDGAGPKTVYIKFRDSAGNISVVYTAEIAVTSGSSFVYLPLIRQ